VRLLSLLESGSGSKGQLQFVDPAPEKNPALFVSGFMPIKNNNFFSPSLSTYYLISLGTFTSVFEYNKALRSHKTVGIKVFLTILAWS
jgi:hypothetical protein